MKRKILIGLSIMFSILLLTQSSVVFAAPVYIDTLGEFPAYPYNTNAYKNAAGDLIGCGPTTGAMIFGYFQHHFGLSDLLDNPVAGVDEGLDTAWELHSANYLKTYTKADEDADPTHQNGFGSVYYIKPGLEDYAADRGHEVKVMAHASVGSDPMTSWYNDYGAYGDAWTDDGAFWVFDGTDWDIDPDLFCDWAEPKLSAGIAIMLTVDADAVEDGGDHWIPCVGIDKAAGMYYYYDTYSTSINSEPIAYWEATAAAGDWAISFVRSIEYIPQATEEPTVTKTVDPTDICVADSGGDPEWFEVTITVTGFGEDNTNAPYEINVIETTQDYIIDESSFSITPDNIVNNADGTDTFAWYDVGDMAGVGDGVDPLTASETFTVTFMARCDTVANNLPVDMDSEEPFDYPEPAVAYYDPSGAAVIVPMPQAYINVDECIAEPEHDVVAVSQTATELEVMPGDLVAIEVTVRNDGDDTETFDVTCEADGITIGTILVVDLAPGEIRVLTFTWDTTGVAQGTYSVVATADPADIIMEVNESNNVCEMPCNIFVVPELPLGTIMASLSMFGALIGYVGLKRRRTK